MVRNLVLRIRNDSLGKEPIDLSAMYIVRHAYSDKATKFVRLHGSMNFAVGGAFCDVMHVIKNYGIVPMAFTWD